MYRRLWLHSAQCRWAALVRSRLRHCSLQHKLIAPAEQISKRTPVETGARTREDNAMPDDAGNYWQPILDGLTLPSARAVGEYLDKDDITGLPKHLSKAPPCLDFHIEMKKRYPEKIVLIQVGDFYETMGLDAVMLIETCQINPMAPEDGIPRAGFPVAHLPKFRSRIVEEGLFSLVVCDQFELPKDASGKSAYGREVTAVYNPGDESYVDSAMSEVAPSVPSAIMCLSWDESGFGLAEFRTDSSAVRVMRGMTEDALWGHLISTTVSAPLCVHTSFQQRVPDWQKRVKSVVPLVVGRIRKLEEPDVIQSFVHFLRKHLAMDEARAIDVCFMEAEGLRRCPSFFTAAQLGMTGSTGIPDLLDFIVPRESLAPVKDWFRQLLLVPKSVETSRLIQEALRLIAVIPDSLPIPKTCLSPGTVLKTFEDSSPSVKFLQRTRSLLSDVIAMFHSDKLRELSSVLLSIVEKEKNSVIDANDFLQCCQQMKQKIEEVVILDSGETTATDGEEEEESVIQIKSHKEILFKFFKRSESFRGIVHDDHLTAELKKIQASEDDIVHAVFCILETLGTLASPAYVQEHVRLLQEWYYGELYFHLPVALLEHPAFHTAGLIHPHWPLGKKEKFRRFYVTSQQLQSALTAYKACCAEASQRVEQLLLQTLNGLSCLQLVDACRFSIAAQSLIHHSWEAQASEWTLPELTESKPLKIINMWPYWMKISTEGTVQNSLELQDMVLLTGPNMTGKSTVLRSIAAVAMLGLSGLYVPAEAVACPVLDHILLRSFAGDNPFDRHSGFSLEMAEMKLAIEQCTDRSLVLIDELGKGTEVKTGGGISASLLEHFAATQSIGIFSTHLHLMKRMPMKMDGISLMKMNTYKIETDENDTPLEDWHVPEWTITPGYNLKSLGIQVAQECELIRHVIERACNYEKALQANAQQPSFTRSLLLPMIEGNNSIPKLLLEEQNTSSDDISDTETSCGANNGVAFCPQPGITVAELLGSFCESKGIQGLSHTSSIQVYHVKPHQDPPPLTARRSCLYVYRRSSGHYYVGETDNLKQRLQSHRRKKIAPDLGKSFDTWYVVISKAQGAKSKSRSLEKELIEIMRRGRFLMESDHDARNKSFGIRE